MPASLHDLAFDELRAEIIRAGLRPSHAGTLYNALHFRAVPDIRVSSDFLPPLRRWIEANVGGDRAWTLDTLPVASATPSGDSLTEKYLLRLQDGQEIETVIMAYDGRFTACLSTQAGCAMGCVFCATGQMGFARHLRPGEIVGQVLHAQRTLRSRGQRLRNLVLMGMGEPLHNYDSVMRALDIITDTRGGNIGPSKVSISTVGVVPGILRMAAERRPYSLAVSLHGSSEEERAALIPANNRWPLRDLIAACRTYGEQTGKRIFFAWTLINGVNDTPAHALRVSTLLRGIDAHINLIPLNETSGYAGHESEVGAADEFQAIIQGAGIPCTIRQRRGLEVAAGCGQLKAQRKRPVLLSHPLAQ